MNPTTDSAAIYLRGMWRYFLFDYPMDGSEGDLETWCARLAEDGWQLWDAGIGAVIDVNGREVRRLSLRQLVRKDTGHDATPR